MANQEWRPSWRLKEQGNQGNSLSLQPGYPNKPGDPMRLGIVITLAVAGDYGRAAYFGRSQLGEIVQRLQYVLDDDTFWEPPS